MKNMNENEWYEELTVQYNGGLKQQQWPRKDAFNNCENFCC